MPDQTQVSRNGSDGVARRFGIHHRTQYDFHQPAVLNAHSLMLFPRKSRDLDVEGFTLHISPDARVNWMTDAFGNEIATARFSGPATTLLIEANCEVVTCNAPFPVFDIDVCATNYPFSDHGQHRLDLAPLTVPRYQDTDRKVYDWARRFVAGPSTDTLSMLKAMNSSIGETMRYESRDREGTQPPAATLACASGSCRDFAVLFAEAARYLGFAARIVSGYLLPNGADGSGTTHAWAELYIPGAGWIAFDSTNRRVGGYDLIPVAVGRDILHLPPATGTFAAPPGAPPAMSVEVIVEAIE